MTNSSNTTHRTTIMAVNSLEDAFKNSLIINNPNIVYIKTSLLKEWTISGGAGFVSKTFGDKSINMFLTFIYKDGDEEFEKNNLENKILHFKLCQLLNQKKG